MRNTNNSAKMYSATNTEYFQKNAVLVTELYSPREHENTIGLYIREFNCRQWKKGIETVHQILGQKNITNIQKSACTN